MQSCLSKMWVFLLAISITIVAGDEWDEYEIEIPFCEQYMDEFCRKRHLPDSFPSSEAELDIACIAINGYLRCRIVTKVIDCGLELYPTPRETRKLYTTVNQVCDKHSQLHKVIVENLECAKGIFEDQIGGALSFLFPPDEEIMKNHEKALIDQGLLKSDEINEICLKTIHGFSSLALKLNKTCGEVAMNAAIEVVVKTTTLFEECEDKIGVLLPAAIVLHKLEEDMEEEREGDQVANPDCELTTHEVCRVHEVPKFIPGSEAEPDIACNAIKVLFQCGISVEESCRFNPKMLPGARQFLTTVNQVCDKHIQLHKDIVENLECAKGFVVDRIGASCFLSQPDEEVIENHEKCLIDQGLVKADEINKTCLETIHVLSCLALKLNKTCGEVAMNAAIEVVVKTPILFEECEDKIGMLLPAAIGLHKLEEAIEAEREENENLHDVIPGLKVEGKEELKLRNRSIRE